MKRKKKKREGSVGGGERLGYCRMHEKEEKKQKTKDCYMNNLSLGDTVEIKAKNKCHESPPQTVSFHGLTGCGLICFLRLSSPLLFFFSFIGFHFLRH